jgi:hypothetical protein
MPGTSISGLLQPPGYETFYSLAHSYSEDLLANAAVIKGASDILARTVDLWSGQIVASGAEWTQLKDNIHSLKVRAGDLQETIRACFWPHVAEELKRGVSTRQVHDLDEAFNRQRWAPYDGDAWDQFFATLVEQLQPQFAAFKRFVHSLPVPDDSMVDNRSAALKEMMTEIRNRINRLESLLDAAQLETIYAPRE